MHRKERGGALGQLAWDDLKFFLVCAESGSFRKAGKLLRVDSATIVRKIGRLEAVVGMRLFNRSTDGVTLTDDACAVLEQVRAMERAVTGIERQSKVSGIGVRGHVRVAITEGLGVYWVLPRLIDFQRANRRLTFELQATMEITDVGRLEADMSIQFLRPERPDLVSVRIGYLHIYPFVSVGYRDLYGIPASLEDAKRHRFIQQVTPLLQEGIYERALGVDSLEGIVGRRNEFELGGSLCRRARRRNRVPPNLRAFAGRAIGPVGYRRDKSFGKFGLPITRTCGIRRVT